MNQIGVRIGVLLTTAVVCVLLILSQLSCSGTDRVATAITEVENGLLPAVLIEGQPSYRLADRMAHYHVPGVSIAVIRDFRIDWVRNYGLRDAELNEPVTDSTLFGVGSLSKAVAAAAVLRLVDSGRFQLDDDVNALLTSWKIPENDLTRRSPVTVRRLLNHSGGLAHSPPYAYLPEAMPTLLQMLKGEPPSSGRPAQVDVEPGTRFQYSNDGFSVLQLLVEDISGMSFVEFMKREVLDPLGMQRSTFEQPLPLVKEAYASAGHQPDGRPFAVKGLAYPHLAAGGLWSTAEEYAHFVIAIQESLRGTSDRLMSRQLAEQMTTPQEAPEYGLGVFMRDRGDVIYFGHIGDARGFVAGFTAHPTDGYGAVVMTNNNNGINLVREIMSGIARTCDWQSYLPRVYTPIDLDPELIQAYTGRYRVGFDETITVFAQNDTLYLRAFDPEGTRLFPISDDTLITQERTGQIIFARDASGQVTGAQYHFADDIGRMLGEPIEAEPVAEDEMIPLEMLLAGRFDDALALYRERMQSDPQDRYVSESRFNGLGYRLLNERNLEGAVAVFRVNVALYPESGNCYDSMGEALLAHGDSTAALTHYRKALKLSPGNGNAAQVVAALEAAGVR